MKVVYEGGVRGYIEVPHLEFNPGQGRGWLSPLFWLKHLELSRQLLTPPIYLASHAGNKQDLAELKRVFVVRQQLHFTDNLKPFLENLSKNEFVTEKGGLKITHITSRIRNSSCVYNIEFSDSATGKLLLYCQSILVKVNENRKSVPFSEKYRKFVKKNQLPSPIFDAMETIHVIRTPPPGGRIYEWSRKLLQSDTDHNGHSNNSVYFSLPFDCLAHAIRDKFTTSVAKNLNEMLIGKAVVEIVKETKEDDVMKVTMWEALPLNFNFVLDVGGNPVAYLKIIFQE